MTEFRKELDRRLKELADVLETKQHDYGAANITKYGLNGIVVRLSDKMARLENLIMQHKDPKHEAVLDTFKDVAGYSLLAWLLMDDAL